MKDNKYAPYILAPILLIVWGLVFYKIYQAVYGEEEGFAMPAFQNIPVFDAPQKDSSFALLLDYNDPFLGKKWKVNHHPKTTNSVRTQPRKVSSPKTVVKTQPATTPTGAPARPFPPIQYQAFQVMEGDTSVFLKIANRPYYNMHKGDQQSGITIEQIYKDSIRLFFDGRAKAFPRM